MVDDQLQEDLEMSNVPGRGWQDTSLPLALLSMYVSESRPSYFMAEKMQVKPF